MHQHKNQQHNFTHNYQQSTIGHGSYLQIILSPSKQFGWFIILTRDNY
eukprot:UN10580